ncbi:MAG TPA: hypothetical protein VHC43_05915 [Mycobacteriales bacterium]|nr:hypothetical protein [Mycobacteriales bacterium]
MTALLIADGTKLFADSTKKVLIDPHPAWGSLGVGIAAAVVFLAFAVWIVIQRVKHGKDGNDD